MADLLQMDLNLDVIAKTLYQKNFDLFGYIKLTQKQYNLVCDLMENTLMEGCRLFKDDFTVEELKKYETNLHFYTTYNVLKTVQLNDKQEINFLFPGYHLRFAINLGEKLAERLQFRDPDPEKKWFRKYIEELHGIGNIYNSQEKFTKIKKENEK